VSHHQNLVAVHAIAVRLPQLCLVVCKEADVTSALPTRRLAFAVRAPVAHGVEEHLVDAVREWAVLACGTVSAIVSAAGGWFILGDVG